jgi:hypothetical protein
MVSEHKIEADVQIDSIYIEAAVGAASQMVQSQPCHLSLVGPQIYAMGIRRLCAWPMAVEYMNQIDSPRKIGI